MKYSLAALAVVSLTASGVTAQGRFELEPYSNWVINYDEDSCALQRVFGEEGQQAYLELRHFGHSDEMQVVVASKDFRRRDGDFLVAFEPSEQDPEEFERFSVDLNAGYRGKLFIYSLMEGSPEREAAESDFINSTPILTDEQRALLVAGQGLDRDTRGYRRLLEGEAYQTGMRRMTNAFELTNAYRTIRDATESSITGVLLDRAFDRRIFLKTGELHAPMQAMRTCLDELVSHWGVDVEAHRSLSRKVEPLDYDTWAGRMQSVYPLSMIARGMQGFLNTRIDVSAEGEPTGCHIQSPINSESFERAACDGLMRARFSPALDAQGQPIASYFQIKVAYLIN